MYYSHSMQYIAIVFLYNLAFVFLAIISNKTIYCNSFRFRLFGGHICSIDLTLYFTREHYSRKLYKSLYQ